MHSDRAKILIVDDISKNIQLVASILKPFDYSLSFALSAKEALDIIHSSEIDLILLDVMMPQMDGFELCELLKKDEKFKHIPIIFLTAKNDAKSIARGFQVGGVDYMSKPFYEEELIARIKTHLEIQRLTKALKEQAKQMQYLANTDALTHVANRLKFNAILEHQIALQKRNPQPLSLIFLDIDFFKRVNDTYGHEVGDTVLITLAKLIKDTIRESDLVARWGGEEFIIVVNGSSAQKVTKLAQKLRALIERHTFEDVGHITCSFGISHYKQDDDMHTFLQRADKALYKAKELGRNRVESLM